MMADVIAPSTTSAFLQESREYQQVWNPEEMTGYMTLLGPNNTKQPVQVKVYRTSIEHFAVVFPHKKVCRPLGVLNLKNTRVEKLQNKSAGFTVRQCGFDTPLCSVTFIPDSPKDSDNWVRAFTCKTFPSFQSTSPPILEEEEEV